MGLVHLGRARLAMALPRHRVQLRSTKNHQLYLRTRVDDTRQPVARSSASGGADKRISANLSGLAGRGCRAACFVGWPATPV